MWFEIVFLCYACCFFFPENLNTLSVGGKCLTKGLLLSLCFHLHENDYSSVGSVKCPFVFGFHLYLIVFCISFHFLFTFTPLSACFPATLWTHKNSSRSLLSFCFPAETGPSKVTGVWAYLMLFGAS